MKRFLLALALLCPLLASATTYYICDCLTGAEGTCAAGNAGASDANNGTAPVFTSGTNGPWQTQAKISAAFFSALLAGDQILYCKGGSISGTAASFQNKFLQSLNATQANPIIIGSYAPAWGGTAKPIITTAMDTVAASIVFNLQNSGNSRHDKGYIIRDLALSGGTRYLGQSTSAGTTTTLNDSGAGWTPSALIGENACLYSGTAANAACRTISANTATQITVSVAWPGGTPDATTKYWIYGGSSGITFNNDVWDVSVTNVSFDGFGSGINCTGGGATTLTDGDGTSKYYVINNSTFTNNANGILSGCSNVLIENNTFDHNSKPNSALDHAIYLDDGINGAQVAYPFKTAVIRHNTFTNNSITAAGTCATTVIVVHGLKTGVEIDDNEINEATVPGSTCWPIQANYGYNIASAVYSAEGFDRLRIRRNKIINSGGVAIDVGISHDGLIEGNSMYTEYASGAFCMNVAGTQQNVAVETDDYQQRNNTIRNNSCYIKNPNAASRGFIWQRHVSTIAETGNVFANNLVYFGTGGTAGTSCFQLTTTASTEFSYWDYNLCYSASVTAPAWINGGDRTTWNGASGFDGHSLFGNNTAGTGNDPLISTPTSPAWSLGIGSTSPAKGAGVASQASNLAYDGCTRPTPPSIGSTEYRASACNPAPNAPNWSH